MGDPPGDSPISWLIATAVTLDLADGALQAVDNAASHGSSYLVTLLVLSVVLLSASDRRSN